ncbi:12S rRNA N4-methylcytidine (m4C) methyltransferase [Sphaerodactylus townsendi]|uniref:12S rRNA N4-methylcytidine (m4C) methyltransferase n=1 Tax=Sphaerodactylus townsendi TaxID=933632 RepID=UPI002027194D|nr:12S rRNA N4-methylcytidine (m4C) methyltransferase [Sphaerodactylus townsendi]
MWDRVLSFLHSQVKALVYLKGWFLYNMHHLLYLHKLCNRFLHCRSIRSSPNCLKIMVKNIHSSLTNECGAEEKSVILCSDETLQYSVDNKDCHQLHIPVMVKEVVNFLEPQQGQHVLDMTFGAGGHTKALLQETMDIKIYALDRDPTAFELAQQLSEFHPQQIQALLGQFSQAEALLTSVGVQPGSLDRVLLDAGCSSMQLDTPERGFSLRKDGPLDMRMDGGRNYNKPLSNSHLKIVFKQSLRFLACFVNSMDNKVHIFFFTFFKTGAFPEAALYARKDLLQRPTHIATKTFQALRIFVNNELHELLAGLKVAEKLLKPGGRLVTLSFHSLEDRIIKRFLYGIDISEKFNLSVRQKIRQVGKNSSEEVNNDLATYNVNSRWTAIRKKVLTPQAKDNCENPRGRSAKLRGAIKL